MNVDRIARVYRLLEYLAFGRTLQRCRTEQLARLPRAPRRVLILGEGDGRFLAALLVCFPAAQVDVVELSGEMIRLARQRLPVAAHGQVSFAQCDALRGWDAARSGEPYDLVVTNFFLDCLATGEAADLIGRIAARLPAGAFWIVGEFGIPAGGLPRWHAVVWVKLMYFCFRVSTGLRTRNLPEYETCLRSAGLRLMNEIRWRWGLAISQLWTK